MERLLGVAPGKLPNTVFCLLSPDGKKQLTRPARGPYVFRTPENMATQMKRIAASYKSSVDQSYIPPVPLIDRVDLAMNVAASDNRPLAVFYHANPDDLKSMVEVVRPIIDDVRLTGQFMFAATTKRVDLKPILKAEGESGVYLVEPDEYGVSGKLVGFVPVGEVAKQLSEEMLRSLGQFRPYQKSQQQHISDGYAFGIEWETVVPESDPMSVQAKQRFKARFNGMK